MTFDGNVKRYNITVTLQCIHVVLEDTKVVCAISLHNMYVNDKYFNLEHCVSRYIYSNTLALESCRLFPTHIFETLLCLTQHRRVNLKDNLYV